MAYDVQGAIKAGANPDDVFNYLAKNTGYNAQAALSAGANKTDILNYMAQLPQKPASQPSGIVNSVVKPVANALAGSEINAGKDISATIAENLPSVKFAQGQAQASNQQLQQVFQQVLQKRHELATQGKDTSELDAVIKEDAQKLGVTNLQELLPEGAKRSTSQIVGDFAGLGLDVATAGSLTKGATSFQLLSSAEKAKLLELGVKNAAQATTLAQKLGLLGLSTLKKSAAGAAVGYGYDVASNLQSGKQGASAFAPGVGTAVGAAIPAAFGLYDAGKLTVSELGSRINNSLIKPLPKQFRYGANPGRTMADLGITGDTFEDLGANVNKAKNEVGQQLSQVTDKIQATTGGQTIDLTKELSPIDEAIQKAAQNNDQPVLNRLQAAKKAITQDLTAKIDGEGNAIIVSNGPRNLQNASFDEALQAKRRIGDLTKFTGNESDDKAVNLALKQVYGRINDATKELARGADPELATQFEKLNRQYGDLQTAEVAINHRSELLKGKNLISLGQGIRGAGAIATAFLTGGPIAALLAGASEVALEKALSSPAVKTRAAAWLAKQTRGELYMFLIDKITSINEAGVGIVLGRKPIKYVEIKKELGISQDTYSRWITKLLEYPYIQATRTPYGISFQVFKAFKRFGKRIRTNAESTSAQMRNLSGYRRDFAESNKTRSVRDNTKDRELKISKGELSKIDHSAFLKRLKEKVGK